MMNSQHTHQTSDIPPSPADADADDDLESMDDDLEFSFAVRDLPGSTAENLSTPVYPIFGRERSGSVSSTSSSVDDLEGAGPQSYCAWAPRPVPASPDRPCKKSSSTGSALKGWRLRDLVVGRSHSDGKDKFVFLARPPEARREAKCKAAEKDGKGSKKVTEMDMATAHRLFYSKGTGANAGGGGRRSFLPYKRDLVGLLGLSRNHPF